MARAPECCLALLLTIAAVACRGGADAGEFVVRDSAGVRIVESFGLPATDDHSWQLGAEPLLTIGRTDGAPGYLFFGLVGGGRLSDGRVYAVDRGSAQVRMFDREGRFLWAVGREGDGPGEFATVGSMAVGPGDTIFAFDSQLGRASLIPPNGESVIQTTLRPTVDGRFQRAYLLPEGRVLAALLDRSDVWTTAAGALATVRYVVFDEDGAQASAVAEGPGLESVSVATPGGLDTYTIPLFAYRSADVVGAGRLFHGISRAREIGVRDMDGRLREVWRDRAFDATLVEQEVVEAARAAYRRRAPDLDVSAIRGAADVLSGDARPPYSRMLLDPEGYLWVAGFAELDEKPTEWIVFSPQGRVVQRLAVPPGLAFLGIGNGEIAARHEDTRGVEALWMLALDR